MQLMLLFIISSWRFEETFVNTHWRKVKQMQTMQLWIVLSNPFKFSYFPTAKQSGWWQIDAADVNMPSLRQAIWGDIWKRTLEKSQTIADNATSSCLNALIHAFENTQWMMTIRCRLQLMYICLLWGKRFEETFVNTLEKSQTNADNATLYCLV